MTHRAPDGPRNISCLSLILAFLAIVAVILTAIGVLA